MTFVGGGPVDDRRGAVPEGDAGTPGTTPPQITDAIRRFQAGGGAEREEAFRLLYETYFRAVQGYFARRVSSPDEALDLTQETFLGIYKGLET